MASWKETSAGHFERPFDSIERFFLALGRASAVLNREHWSVSAFARFQLKASPTDTEIALRHAWKTMRYDHPQLACFARDETKIYEVPDSNALDAWLCESFIVAPASATKEELLASFRPSPLATLYYLPAQSEIIIHSSHWRTDAIGAVSILQNFFQALATPRPVQFGEEWRNLSPSRDEAAIWNSADGPDPPTSIQGTHKVASDLVAEFTDNMPSIGLPAQNPTKLPGGTRRSEVVLEQGTTTAIVDASKRRGLTVTTALHAALIVALQQITDASLPSSGKYMSMGVYDIRRLLKPPSNDVTIHPDAAQIIGLPLVVTPSTYAELALQLKQYYKQRSPLSTSCPLSKSIVVDFTNQMAVLAGQVPDSAPSEPLLSSLGILDGYLKPRYGDIHVKKFWIGVEMMTPQVTCYLWTWQGKMTLSALYNEMFYEEQFIQAFLRRVINIVLKELAIQRNE